MVHIVGNVYFKNSKWDPVFGIRTVSYSSIRYKSYRMWFKYIKTNSKRPVNIEWAPTIFKAIYKELFPSFEIKLANKFNNIKLQDILDDNTNARLPARSWRGPSSCFNVRVTKLYLGSSKRFGGFVNDAKISENLCRARNWSSSFSVFINRYFLFDFCFQAFNIKSFFRWFIGNWNNPAKYKTENIGCNQWN